MLIVWDEPRQLSNFIKQGFDFADLDEAFFLPAAVVPVRINRQMAIGRLSDGIIAVTLSRLASERLSVISMRRTDRDERNLLFWQAN
jgi:uncharacterized protein